MSFRPRSVGDPVPLPRPTAPPYNPDVMEKVSELQRIGFVKFGFDRAGTSTAVET
eukprot:COSAG02_NODE_72146_length_187_cov_96.465909_1_plen_54_part_01